MPGRGGALRGVALALGAFALFSLHDVAVKLLGGGYSVFQVVFFSVLLSFPLVVLMLLRDPEPGTLLPRHPGWTALRTACTTVTATCVFYAFATLPLAQVYAIIFTMPLLITVLSIPVLGERVGLHRGAAVVVGLGGVLIVLRPGATDLELGHAAALVAALASSLASVIVRRIGRAERTAVLLLYPMMANVVAMGAVLPFVYRPIPLADFGLWALLAALAFGASLLIIQAYRAADAALVAPMQYSQILWAALYGAVLFDETVDGGTALGAGVIIASGLYVVLREARGASARTPVLRTRSRVDTGTTARVSPLLTPSERDGGLPAPRGETVS